MLLLMVYSKTAYLTDRYAFDYINEE